MKIKKKIKIVLNLALSFLLFFFICIPISLAETSQVKITSAIDTIAGYSGLIKASADPNSEMEFIIARPDGTSLIIPSETDEDGIAKLDINGYHLKKAGIYQVAGKLNDEENYSSFSTFQVHADELSLDKSEINISKQTINSNGQDNALLTIKLLDKYSNPIPNHTVDIISSREEDKISPVKKKSSDQNGEVQFTISSEENGISIYSAFDTSIGKTLSKRVKAVYQQTSDLNNFIGGETNVMMIAANDTANPNDDLDTLDTDSQGIGPITALKIEDLPEKIEINQSINFKISVQDEENNLIPNYEGTVHFSIESDSNAKLPADYTFTPDDLGEHTFSLSLSFSVVGNHTLKVKDINNDKIKGEKAIIVEKKDITKTSGTESKVQISAPQAGTYNYRNITIEGSAPNFAPIIIYDNDKEIGKTTADNQGRFSFTSETLNDGPHLFYVVSTDEKGTAVGTSEELKIAIDTEPPAIDSVEIFPPGHLKSGDKFTIKLYSEKNLSQVAAIFNDNLNQMIPNLDSSGLYTAELTAPEKGGEYPLDFVLVDELGNEDTIRGKAAIIVSGNEAFGTEAPAKVLGIKASSGDNRITLTWQGDENSNKIKNYRIYYGVSPEDLSSTVNTFDNKTTWYIPNLSPDQTYYFALTAINMNNNESMEKSDVISSSPLPEELEKKSPPDKGENECIENEECYFQEKDSPAENTDSGPETIWIIACSVMFVELVFLGKKLLQKKSGTTKF